MRKKKFEKQYLSGRVGLRRRVTIDLPGPQVAILKALEFGHVARRRTHYWRWLGPRPNPMPSLANEHTSALFRAGLVSEREERGYEKGRGWVTVYIMTLSEMGEVVCKVPTA